MASLFVGVMSGTSLDGADAALIDFSSQSPRTLAFDDGRVSKYMGTHALARSLAASKGDASVS